MDRHTPPEDFWQKILEKIRNLEHAVRNAYSTKEYLLSEEQSRWLPGVLNLLPQDHAFNSIVYLNLGYDNIVYGRNVALNLGHPPFHTDHREAIYYLMHELAHTGYLQYHRMVDLASPRTWGELAGNVMFLTQLEGMGVLTPLQLRAVEDGLKDPDYVALNDSVDKMRRVHYYFEKLAILEKESNKVVNESDLSVYDEFSCRPLRLWYVAGCHMAQVIEAMLGTEELRRLVKEGSKAFFEAYRRAYATIGLNG
ncbi:MAG: hypothetical protein NTY03_10675 [Candidatus Bathyarchaeota archaeon]|nr:hypothetical protein [Candidatus Bathyarchaeota archaeon]